MKWRYLILLFLLSGVSVLALAIRFDDGTNSDVSGTPVGQAPDPVATRKPTAAAEETASVDLDIELDKDKQKAIWDAEHVTFEIEKKFGASFRKALEQRDADELRARFLPHVQGRLPLDDSLSAVEHGPLVRRTAVDGTTGPAELKQIVDWLLNVTSEFASISRSKLRVLAIDKVDDSAEAWSTRILLSLTGTQDDGDPLQLTTLQKVVLSIPDESALGSAPAIQEWQHESIAKHAGTQALFREVTDELHLDKAQIADNWNLPPRQVAQYRFQIAVADFDLDGLLDIAVSSRESWLLLTRESADGPYRDVSQSLGIDIRHRMRSGPAWLAAWLDFDNDGYPDLLMGNRLYRNVKGERFDDVTNGSGLRFDVQAMGAQVADFDCDGRVDLYVVLQGDESAGDGKTMSWVNDDNNGGPNRLFRNLGNGRFEDVTRQSGAGGGNRDSLAACWFFYDDDHYPDLYIANDFARNVLLRNKGDGTFEDVSELSGASDYATSMGVAAGDLNNDGASDLYVANMFSKMGRRIIGHVTADDYPTGLYQQIQGSCSGNRLYLSGGHGKFQDIGEEVGVDAVGWAYAPAMIDVDNDGWLDLYATTGFLSFDRNEPDG